MLILCWLNSKEKTESLSTGPAISSGHTWPHPFFKLLSPVVHRKDLLCFLLYFRAGDKAIPSFRFPETENLFVSFSNWGLALLLCPHHALNRILQVRVRWRRLSKTQYFRFKEGKVKWQLSQRIPSTPCPLGPFLFRTENRRMPLRSAAGPLRSHTLWTPVGKAGSASHLKYYISCGLSCPRFANLFWLFAIAEWVMHFTGIFWKGETPPFLKCDSHMKRDSVKTPTTHPLSVFLVLPDQFHFED